MTTSNELLIVKTEDGIAWIQKVWMKDDLDAIRWGIEKLNTSDLVQNGIASIVRHVMRCDRWQRVTLEGKYSALE
jgi:hypothetical protein